MVWRAEHTFIAVLLFFVPLRSSAWGSFFFPLMLGEIRLASTTKVKDQADFPYCGLYAMASFLELLGESTGEEDIPTLSVSYLALSYQAFTNEAVYSTDVFSLSGSVEKFGVLPSRVWDRLKHPVIRNWRSEVGKNDISSDLLPLIEKYRADIAFGAINGSTFLREVINTDPSRWVLLKSKRFLGEVASGRKFIRNKNRERPVMPDIETKEIAHYQLYDAVVDELYNRKPVYVSVEPDLVKDDFALYRTIGRHNLRKQKPDKIGHAVVAIAHCDDTESNSDPCNRFVNDMRRYNIPECVVLQNSWGVDAHADGMACVSRNALSEMMVQALFSEAP